MNIQEYKGYQYILQPLGDVVNVTLKNNGDTFFRQYKSEPFECCKYYWEMKPTEKLITNNELLDIAIEQFEAVR